ncbi:MAG TPA: sugar transferase [Acidimicrobiia bacterium]|nr:sugar transferase [Acidimicrobiia bacterium]
MSRAARGALYGGTALVVLSLGKFHAAFIGDYDFTGSSRFSWSIAYVLVLCVAAYGVGLPDLPRNAYQALGMALGGTAASAVAMSLVQVGAGSLLLPRFVVFWAAVFLVPLWTLSCFLSVRGRRRQEGRDRAFVVSGAQEAAALADELHLFPEKPATLVGVLAPADAAENPDELLHRAVTARASVLVLSREAQSDEQIVDRAALLHERGIRVRTFSLFYEEWLGKLPLTELERVALMFDIGELHRVRYGRIKRGLDLLVALPCLVTLAALLPFVAVANIVGNRGPLLYRQRRVGRAGKEFTIFKLRTMRPGGDDSTWTAEDDPRITPFGRWLRRSHLDELPQAVNLLRGDLSVVGPRPEQPHYVDELSDKIRFYRLRHLVRPGITGWAQVKCGYAANERDAVEKLQYEFWYLRHQGLAVDARIVGRTVRSVLRVGGR